MYTILKKYIFWFLFFILLVFPIFGSANDDCTAINAAYPTDFLKFMPIENFEIARKHLIAYCCREKPTLEVLIEKCDNLENWAESPYWFDQLLDVGLRSLDAREEEMYPDMIPDPLWKEWREFITDTEQTKNMEKVQQEYIKYWWFSMGFPTLDQGLNRGYIWALSSAPTLTLADMYMQYCFVMMIMYQEGLGLKNINVTNYYDACVGMVKNRIDNESSLALLVAQQSSANMLLEGLTSYTKQFVQGRLMLLYDKLVAISNLFVTVGKQAPLSDTCQQ